MAELVSTVLELDDSDDPPDDPDDPDEALEEADAEALAFVGGEAVLDEFPAEATSVPEPFSLAAV
jgi:hypothetical protein